jgi:hypothetical protein
MSDEPLSALEAASAIREVAGWSDRLRQRVAGLTWMFWGMVTPAIFVSYALGASAGVADAPWFGLLWLPWAALGLLFTWLLWRSSRVAAQDAPVSWRELGVHAALFVAATVGVAIIVVVLRLPLAPPTGVLVGLGLVTAMLAVRDAATAGPHAAAVVQAVGGLALLAFGLQQALAQPGLAAAALSDAVASAVVLVGVGTFRTTRG